MLTNIKTEGQVTLLHRLGIMSCLLFDGDRITRQFLRGLITVFRGFRLISLSIWRWLVGLSWLVSRVLMVKIASFHFFHVRIFFRLRSFERRSANSSLSYVGGTVRVDPWLCDGFSTWVKKVRWKRLSGDPNEEEISSGYFPNGEVLWKGIVLK